MSVLTYLNTFLLGGDLISVLLGTVSVRAVTFTLLLSMSIYLLHARRITYSRDQLIIYGLFVFAIVLSIPQSIDPVRSIAYLFWMLFLGLVQTAYYNFEYKRWGEDTLRLMLLRLYRICAILLIFETVIRTGMDGSRARLFFYEPAHTAIYMIPYVVLALASVGKKPITRDVALSLIAMIVSASATAFFSIIGTLILCFIFLHSARRTIWLVAAGFAGLVFTMSLAVGLADHFNLFVGFLRGSENLSHAMELIFHRSGTRVIRLYYGIEAFYSAPIFGIGAGAANAYTATHGIPTAALIYFNPEWDNVYANPFVNPFVEIGATLGVTGLFAFGYLLMRLTVRARTFGLPQIMAIAALAMFIGISLESTVLRHYIWFAVSLAMVARRQDVRPPKQTPIFSTQRPAPRTLRSAM